MSRSSSKIATLMFGFAALATLAVTVEATHRPPPGLRKALELMVDKPTVKAGVVTGYRGNGSNGE